MQALWKGCGTKQMRGPGPGEVILRPQREGRAVFSLEPRKLRGRRDKI